VARAAKAVSVVGAKKLGNYFESTDSIPASQAKCSCGQQSALHCTCGKAESENKIEGPRCSCRKFLAMSHWYIPILTSNLGARPAGACTCDRAATENSTPSGSLCSCGARPAGEYPNVIPLLTTTADTLSVDACTCEKAPDAGTYPDEIDFTTTK
jgi:hypothetical protein